MRTTALGILTIIATVANVAIQLLTADLVITSTAAGTNTTVTVIGKST